VKIIQSLYTHSLIDNEDGNISKINTISGVSSLEQRSFFWYTWFNSVMSFIEKGMDVELVTDNLGKKMLVDRLGFPYKTIKTDLENLPKKSKYLWGIGKLKAYLGQDQPFLYFDGDAFYKKELPEIDCNLFLQEVSWIPAEYNDDHYLCAKDMIKHFKNVPPQIKKIVERYDTQSHIAKSNTGVFGGNDLDLIKRYSSTILNFIEENCDDIDNFLSKKSSKYITFFMSVLEELSILEFYQEKYGELDSIGTALGHHKLTIKMDINYKNNLERKSKETGYVHMMGIVKKTNNEDIINYRKRLVNDTRKKYPEYSELLDYYLNK